MWITFVIEHTATTAVKQATETDLKQTRRYNLLPSKRKQTTNAKLYIKDTLDLEEHGVW